MFCFVLLCSFLISWPSISYHSFLTFNCGKVNETSIISVIQCWTIIEIAIMNICGFIITKWVLSIYVFPIIFVKCWNAELTLCCCFFSLSLFFSCYSVLMSLYFISFKSQQEKFYPEAWMQREKQEAKEKKKQMKPST